MPLLTILAITGPTACARGPSEPGYTIIDDMEGASGIIEWKPPTASPGGWSSFTDVQPDAILPPPSSAGGLWSYDSVPVPYQTRPGIISSRAAHVRTIAPLINEWGAGMGFDLAILPAPAVNGKLSPVGVDLTAFKGLTFWGMASSPGVTEIAVQVDDSSTHPAGGRCDPAATDNPRTACFNSFSFSVKLTSTFAPYTVDFSQFKQAAFGYKATPEVALDKVYDISFAVRTPGGFCPLSTSCAGALPTLTFDIWVDDLYFVDK